MKKSPAYDEAIKMLEQGVKDVFTSEKYIEFMKFINKFHKYSFNNCFLIMQQNPNATLIAGFNDWKNKHKRFVKKGEKGIKIFVPMPYKEKKDRIVYDENKNPVIVDGKPLTETVTVDRVNFRIGYVYDVSQTDGEPLPELSSPELTATVDNYNDIFTAISSCTEFNIEFDDLPDGTKGLCSYIDNTITINNGMSESQNIKTLIHEVAHSRLHAPSDELDENKKAISRRDKEVQAESIAFVVANHFGIDTSEYSFDYIAGWSSDKELNELKESLETIQTEASLMIDEIEQQYSTITQNKEIETIIVNPEQEIDRDMDGIEDSKDSSYTVSDFTSDIIRQKMFEYGYNSKTMLPINKEMAKDLYIYNKDVPVYILYPNNTESQVESINDIINKDNTIMFGIQTDDIKPVYLKQQLVEISNQILNEEKSLKRIEKEMDNYYDEYGHVFESNFPNYRRTLDKIDSLNKEKTQILYQLETNIGLEPPKAEVSQQKYDKEENKRIIENIKQNIPIQDYAQQMGYTVVSVGNYYTLKEHDSVRINPNKNRFVRNSTGAKGSIIDFVMEFEKISEQSAIDKLAKYIGAEPLPPAQIKTSDVLQSSDVRKELVLPQKAKSMRNIFAYLINTRKIDSQIVSQWVKNGNLYQDVNNNCVFVTYNKQGKPEFASQRGTHTEKMFKADVPGSNYDTCHFINNNATNLIIGESVIDIMSVQTILKAKGRDLNNYNYLSLNGNTKTHAVLNALKESNTTKAILATDKDNAGELARNELRATISEYDNNIKIIDYVPQNEKDWNAELVSNVLKEEKNIVNKSSSLTDKISDYQEKADKQNMNISSEKQFSQDKKKEPNLS